MEKHDFSKSLPDRLEEILRERILTGEIRLGQKLGIQAICKEFSLSSTPVRDALNRLTLQGIIQVSPRVGYFVRNYSRKEADDLFYLRTLLEVGALEQALPYITGEDLSVYRQLNQPYHERTIAKDHIYTFAREESIHLLIVKKCENAFLQETYQKIYDQISALLSLYPKTLTTFADHTDLIEAIAEKRRENAVYTLKEHIRNARRVIDPYISPG